MKPTAQPLTSSPRPALLGLVLLTLAVMTGTKTCSVMAQDKTGAALEKFVNHQPYCDIFLSVGAGPAPSDYRQALSGALGEEKASFAATVAKINALCASKVAQVAEGGFAAGATDQAVAREMTSPRSGGG